MKKYLPHLITLGFSLVIIFLILLSKDIFKQTEPKMILLILTDVFFAVGVLLTGMGLLVVASNGGTFDMITFGVKKFFSYFKREDRQLKQTFYDYRKLKLENQHSFGFFLTVGIFLIVVSLIFLYFLYKVQ